MTYKPRKRKRGTNYIAGREKEYAAMKYLEATGHGVMRSAGSHGTFDLCAWDGVKVRFIQVKYNCYFESENERQTFLNAVIPFDDIKEVWVYIKGNRLPLIMKEEVVKNVRNFKDVYEIASDKFYSE